MSPSASAAQWHRAAVASVLALALLEILWELLLAPIGPGGSWLVLKALPLALLWPGLARGARRSRQWASLILPLYFGEAVVRAISESGRHAFVAAMASVVAACAFAAVILSFREERRAIRG